jgi:hypothetical protein
MVFLNFSWHFCFCFFVCTNNCWHCRFKEDNKIEWWIISGFIIVHITILVYALYGTNKITCVLSLYGINGISCRSSNGVDRIILLECFIWNFNGIMTLECFIVRENSVEQHSHRCQLKQSLTPGGILHVCRPLHVVAAARRYAGRN